MMSNVKIAKIVVFFAKVGNPFQNALGGKVDFRNEHGKQFASLKTQIFSVDVGRVFKLFHSRKYAVDFFFADSCRFIEYVGYGCNGYFCKFCYVFDR